MEPIDIMREFVMSYPHWEEGGFLFIDYTDGVPGNSGLFPQGYEELGRRMDVVGNLWVDCRLHFALYRVCDEDVPHGENGRWLAAFQAWVQEQSVRGLAPRFGDVPLRERLRAQRGAFHKPRGGAGLYGLELTADFTKFYEVK